jgi:hypothetical protein
MLVAKPAPEEKIRELANVLSRGRSGIAAEGFLLPRSQDCNYQWNVQSTRSFAFVLDWYLHEEGLLSKDPRLQESALSDLLAGIVDSPDHTVVADGKPMPLSVDYLRQTDNWISNHTAISILQALSRQLGPQYSDPHITSHPPNPWLAATQFALARTTEAIGFVQKLMRLRDGPQAVYLDFPAEAATFSRIAIYEVVSDLRLSARRRRVTILRHSTNYFYTTPEWVGFNAAFYGAVPQLFSRHPILRRIPGFDLDQADVLVEFPDGDYSGTWEITVDYETTPVDHVRSRFNVGELQEEVATLSAEVLELQRDRKALSEEAERLAGRLVEEE